MKLVEEEGLNLDAKVFGPDGILNDSIYLNYRDEEVEEITIHHLLNHSGGWTTRWGDQMFMPIVIVITSYSIHYTKLYESSTKKIRHKYDG